MAFAAALALVLWAAQVAPAPRDWLTDLADDGSLVAGLLSRDAEVRALAARGLGRVVDDKTAGPLVAAALKETEPRALVEMLFALGQWGSPQAGAVLEHQLAHADTEVRATAAEALGKLKDDRRTPALVARLSDGDPVVRGAAVLALVRLDGRRYDHERTLADDALLPRDEALAQLALKDEHPEVRWRAAYALANLRGRRAFPTVLGLALQDDEPLVRAFALRGLAALERDGLGTVGDVEALLADADVRVATEAAAALGVSGPLERLAKLAAGHEAPVVRRVAVEAIAARKAAPADVLAALETIAEEDRSSTVRREARTALVTCGDPARAEAAFLALARSAEPVDREHAADLLERGAWRDDDRLALLLEDDVPLVRGKALEVLAKLRHPDEGRALREGLTSADPAVLTGAAKALAARVAEGGGDPDLLRLAADALERSSTYEWAEARIELLLALGLPPETAPADPPARPAGRLLDRLAAEAAQARADPRPHVALETARGSIEIELYRTEAPRHVASLLELAAAGAYDGLTIHRVVPDFVAQGLDPRGDGWGTAGRRVPDEINRLSYITGTVGMPNAGRPHTGGCQVFMTHVPTPHLDGRYTVFGQVVAGQEIVDALQIGDVIRSVRRIDEAPVPEESK